MKHFSLLEFTQVIKKTLEKNLDPTYWVVGEIGELRVHPKGHCYLELVEKENEKIVARMKATIWASSYNNLAQWFKKITGSELQEGMKILANVETQFHEAFGLSLNVRDIDANYTLGERLKVRQQILNRLREEELIGMNKAVPLPLVPQRIAVISSPHSAGYDDFLKQLTATEYHIETPLYPAEMQGSEATRSIVDALKRVFEDIHQFDLVVILRGGGAQSDLDSFNTYLIGKAIARFPLPVITGIGHERDETIADIVARLSLKTPTAVAEFVIKSIADFENHLTETFESVITKVKNDLVQNDHTLHQIAEKIRYGSKQFLTEAAAKSSLLDQKIQHGVRQVYRSAGTELDGASSRIAQSMRVVIDRSNQRLEVMDKLFQLSDPQYTLQKGFTYTTKDGKPLDIAELQIGDKIKTRTANQTVESKIERLN